MGKLFHITNPYFYVGGPPNFNSWLTYEYSVVSSVTRGNQPLKIFAKSRVFNADLYSDLIAKTFRDDLRVQTWQSTKICIKQISRIGSMQFYDGFKFRSTVDHSKWAVTENLNWICIADLNIRKSQYGRGGLAVCLNHKDLANEFRSIAWNTIPCKEIPLGVCPSYG
ncbi:cell-death-related nuclease 7-like [Saccostrea echinata]|uniref:cell-death-related nuclease 7-like n=1 Tax=Saccostrea echinata TaxID=191078 RepID=UPI002A832E80|nr:cell-death-related nuclease 7-like [Saccostrea echinata]